ncbi:DUF1127 domain-containing protein [Chelativorans sp. YIM 93263]|uniref:DUF1127 domain-containing protein n=1 Tax=Chelativorans sp. YIM 93263 TaxID=2906648 RepID=UPI002378E6ED|nr:DUF1127 domain-containing protein [Chelativorans sp. YIM 93263]
MQNTVATRRERLAVRSKALCRLAADALTSLLSVAERRRQRLHLSELDDHLLADVGLTPEEVRRECAKPFWC